MGAETPHWPCAENKEDLVKGSGPLRGHKTNLRSHKIKIQIFLLHSIYDGFFFLMSLWFLCTTGYRYLFKWKLRIKNHYFVEQLAAHGQTGAITFDKEQTLLHFKGSQAEKVHYSIQKPIILGITL